MLVAGRARPPRGPPRPEIEVADLTSFALELAAWGDPDGAGLALLDPPPAVALATARAVLADLGAVDPGGRLTARGRELARLPLDPRLARALLDGAALVGTRRAAEVVAMLDEDVRAPGGDLVAALRSLRRGGPGAAAWQASVRRLEALLPAAPAGAPRPGPGDDLAVGAVVALAHPDRIARLRPGGTSYLMVGGTGAVLRHGDTGLTGTPWLAVADAERRPGARDATVRAAAPVDEDLALEAAAGRWVEEDRVTWEQGRVLARRVSRLGAIELSSAPLADPDPADVAAVVTAAVAREGLEGLGLLRRSPAADHLRRRLALLHRVLGEPWPDVADDALLAALDLGRVRSQRDLERLDVLGALRSLLPWPAAARLDELVPERVRVPSGASPRVAYGEGDEQPVLAVRVQEVFGLAATPRIVEGRVPLLLHLLTPAGRPAAVTADLASFWTTGYPQVRAELRGRYPRHPWPEDPTTAPASAPGRRGRPAGPAGPTGSA